MRKNLISVITIILAISLLMAGCGSAEERPVSAPEAGTTTERSAAETTTAEDKAGSQSESMQSETEDQNGEPVTKKTVVMKNETTTAATKASEVASKATQKTTVKQTTTQKATQKQTTTQKPTQKQTQKATQKQTTAATKPTTKPAVTQPTTTKKKTTTYPTMEQVYAPIKQWSAGYSVYGVPVYRVKSKSDYTAFCKAHKKCVELARAKFNAAKTVSDKMHAYPCAIVSSLFFYDGVNKARKEARNGLSVEEYSKKYDVYIDDIPGDVTFNATIEEIAAARVWEETLSSMQYYYNRGWTCDVHDRPAGLIDPCAENASYGGGLQDGVELWRGSEGHWSTITDACTGEGEAYAALTSAIIPSAYEFLQAGIDEDGDVLAVYLVMGMPSSVKAWKNATYKQKFGTLKW